MFPEDTVRYGNKQVPVIGKMNIGRREYCLLKKTSHGDRQQFLACEKHPGFQGDFRQIVVLPRKAASRQHLAVLRRLSYGNPNLPTILECRRQGEELIVITTWAHGRDLQSRSENTKISRPSPTEVMRLYRGLAHGLSQMYRHAKVIHGDINPANLILAEKSSRLVMIDFGSAWMMEKTVRRDDGDGDTKHFAAPELLMQKPGVDFRADQFSASAVAYWMLAGKPPYGGIGGLAGTPEYRDLYEPLYQPPSRVSPFRKQIPKRIWRRIDEVLNKALALDANRRYQSSHLWLDDLEDLNCEIRQHERLSRADHLLFRFFRWLKNWKCPCR
jgi:serine/threonine protein kinase